MTLMTIAGAGMKFIEKAFQAREMPNGETAPLQRPQQRHNADQPRSINFQNALANLVSKSPQGITTQASSGGARSKPDLMALFKPQAA